MNRFLLCMISFLALPLSGCLVGAFGDKTPPTSSSRPKLDDWKAAPESRNQPRDHTQDRAQQGATGPQASAPQPAPVSAVSASEAKYTLPLLQQFDDGTRMVALSEVQLQARAPDSVELYRKKPGMFEVVWGNSSKADYVKIDTKTELMHPTAKSKIDEMEIELRAFSLGEQGELSDGFDLYYSYFDSKLDKRLGYYGQRTIAGNRYRCYLSLPSNLAAVTHARRLCRSLEPLRGEPVGGP